LSRAEVLLEFAELLDEVIFAFGLERHFEALIQHHRIGQFHDLLLEGRLLLGLNTIGLAPLLGDDAENGLGVTLLDGYGSIGDQGPVTAPAFHLGLVDDNVRPVAIERSGPW